MAARPESRFQCIRVLRMQRGECRSERVNHRLVAQDSLAEIDNARQSAVETLAELGLSQLRFAVGRPGGLKKERAIERAAGPANLRNQSHGAGTK